MTILDEIKAYKLADVAERKAARSLAEIEALAHAADPVRPFGEALTRAAMGGGYGLIAEIKKASPSKGVIREDFDPVALARAYEEGGAACLSVLTDRPSFQGDDGFLALARNATKLPALRKDFLFDPWQVVESRALGADCILIILAAVTDVEASALEEAAIEWGMDVLIETHNEEELARSRLLRSNLVGINNRDLRTFVTDLDVTRRLARDVGADRTIISESGISTRQDLAKLASYGVRCFLVGETLMREENVEGATRELLRSPWTPEAG
ncbi:MAG: indole-3-glycerol phosphate synthase TrpC [Rhodovulum sulfidophilum]|uniref:Indole-3-glycerol phosphate synthase n=1 Tax=Rhodovulum sulfidophilum TaxID=35806 RepID=A0A2W5Q1V1_RHOSU|nr:MAG: indole-3-glycerol phosphate synthase TrpC [Rhodovulum sulfidophilum]